jgi:hypothetical protein
MSWAARQDLEPNWDTEPFELNIKQGNRDDAETTDDRSSHWGARRSPYGDGSPGARAKPTLVEWAKPTSERWMERISGVWAAIASATSGVAIVLATATTHASSTNPMRPRNPTATDRGHVVSVQIWCGAGSEAMTLLALRS